MPKLQFKKANTLPPRWKLPTGSYSLNRALDGGLESGRFHCFWGPKSSTKSTNALYSIANAQKMGKHCIYVDAEKTFDAEFAEKCGVDTSQLDLADEGANIAEGLLEALLPKLDKQEADVIVLDSVSSILQGSFFDKPENNPIGIYSRSAKFVLAKMLNSMHRDTQIILISHASIDFSGFKPMLSAQMGNAQSHWTSNIIGFKANDGKDNFRVANGEPDGYRLIKWKFAKTKQPVWPFDGQYYFNGRSADIDQADELVTAAILAEIITKSGSWYDFNDLHIQGAANLADCVREEPEWFSQLDNAMQEYDSIMRKTEAKTIELMEPEDETE